jgi:DNA-binding transcriptional MocR family regulator
LTPTADSVRCATTAARIRNGADHRSIAWPARVPPDQASPPTASGIVYSRAELEQIADLARRLDIWVFSDEEYEKTLLDGSAHHSIAALPGMRERTISAFSFSKAYAMTAYRIGYAVGPAKAIDHLHSILRFSLQACPAVGQRAAHAVLTGDMEPWLRTNTANLERKRNYLAERLNRIPRDPVQSPEGLLLRLPRRPGARDVLIRADRAPLAPGPRLRRARLPSSAAVARDTSGSASASASSRSRRG